LIPVQTSRGDMQTSPGTYAILLLNTLPRNIQIGRWKQVSFDQGYYLYIGSAFGPGGLRARVGRHCRKHKTKRWHIDYLSDAMDVSRVWVDTGGRRLEHEWAGALQACDIFRAIDGFGCSDCTCRSHLYHSVGMPSGETMKALLPGDLRCMKPTDFNDDAGS